jgi:hypothetical protein
MRLPRSAGRISSAVLIDIPDALNLISKYSMLRSRISGQLFLLCSSLRRLTALSRTIRGDA